MKNIYALILLFSMPAFAHDHHPKAESVPALPIPTAEQKQSEEKFAHARQLQDLEAAGIPFHLKATYTATGDAEFTGSGTYEVWWQSKDVWRKQGTLGNYKFVAVKNGIETAGSATSTYMPLRMLLAINPQIFHIGIAQHSPAKWKSPEEATSTDLSAHETQNQPCPSDGSLLCVEDYEFAADGTLRSYRYNDLSETYSDLQPFGKLLFPRQILLKLQSEPIVAMSITQLEPLGADDPSRFNPKSVPQPQVPGELALPGIFTPAPGGTKAPKLRSHPNIKYPRSERKNHTGGAVLIMGIVDTEGNFREPYVLRSNGAAFDEEALKGARKYKFKPATLNGQPISGCMLIVVEFHA